MQRYCLVGSALLFGLDLTEIMEGQAPPGVFAATSQIPAQGASNSSKYQAQSHFLPEAASADATEDGAASNVPAENDGSGELYVALVDSDASSSLAKNNHKLLAFRNGDYLVSTQVIGDWHWGHIRGKDSSAEYGYFHLNSVRKAVQVTLKPSCNGEESDGEKQDAKPAAIKAVKTEDENNDEKSLAKDDPIKTEDDGKSKGTPSCCQMISFDQDIDSWKARLRFPSGEVDDNAVISSVFGQASNEPDSKKNPEHARLEDEFGCYIDLPSVVKEGSGERRYQGEVYVRSKNQRILERAGDAIAKLLDEAAAGRSGKDISASGKPRTETELFHVREISFLPKYGTWGVTITSLMERINEANTKVTSVFGKANGAVSQTRQKDDFQREYGCKILLRALQDKGSQEWVYSSIEIYSPSSNNVHDAKQAIVQVLGFESPKLNHLNTKLKWKPPESVQDSFTAASSNAIPEIPKELVEIGLVKNECGRFIARINFHPLVDKTACAKAVFGSSPGNDKTDAHRALERKYACDIHVQYNSGRNRGYISVSCGDRNAFDLAATKIVGLLRTHGRMLPPKGVCRPQQISFKNGHFAQFIPVAAKDLTKHLMRTVFGAGQIKTLERRFGCTLEINEASFRVTCRNYSDGERAVAGIIDIIETQAKEMFQVWKIWPRKERKHESAAIEKDQDIAQAPERTKVQQSETVALSKQPKCSTDKKRELDGAECASFADGDDGDIAAGASKRPRLSSDTSSENLPHSIIQVSPELAASSRFPLGCHVMHHVVDTVVPGKVAAIYMKLESPALVAGSRYDVCYDIGKLGSTTAFVSEKELQFAPRCTVSVDPSFVPEGQIVFRDPDGWIRGEIISSFTSPGEEIESYMVTLLNGAGKVSGVPRNMLRFRKSLPLLKETKVKPAAFPTEQEDASTASALGSMSSSFVGSTVTDTGTTIVRRLAVPPEIETVAVKKHLYGDDGSIATKMSHKLGISIAVVGLGLGIEMSNIGGDTSSGDQQSPCVVLKGFSHRIGKATKVIEHILIEKAYNGDDKDSIRAQLQWSGDGLQGFSSLSGSVSPKKKPIDKTMIDEPTREVEIDHSEEGEIMTEVARVEESARPEDEDVPETFEKISSAISIIVMEKGPLLVGQVNTEFRRRYGCPIDYRKLSYDKLKDLLIAVPHVYLKTTTRHDNGRTEIYVHSQLGRMTRNLMDLVEKNSPVSLKDLKPMYREKYRSPLDHERFGFKKLKDFVETFPCFHLRITGKNTMMIYFQE